MPEEQDAKGNDRTNEKKTKKVQIKKPLSLEELAFITKKDQDKKVIVALEIDLTPKSICMWKREG